MEVCVHTSLCVKSGRKERKREKWESLRRDVLRHGAGHLFRGIFPMG